MNIYEGLLLEAKQRVKELKVLRRQEALGLNSIYTPIKPTCGKCNTCQCKPIPPKGK